jgi:hypothetical protein
MIKCERCDSEIKVRDKSFWRDGQRICESCFDDGYACPDCGAFTIGLDVLCPDCLNPSHLAEDKE